MSRKTLTWITLLLALFASGAAGLINQVVWQRALKVFLGGSESISSMIVVLVFLAGLGAGSWVAGRFATRLRNPLLALGLLELALGLVNIGVRALLATDISDSVFAVQRVAHAMGLGLWVVYALGACLVLALPCLLMGATMPFAGEACQRRLQEGTDAKVLGWLIFANTIGSVAGTVFGSGYLMPQFGRGASLFFAAALNLSAGLLALSLCLRTTAPAQAEVSSKAPNIPLRRGTPSYFEWLSLALGFCALGYEMLLLRLIALRHEPLPFTFAAVLAGFLLFWSIGAALSSSKRGPSLSTAMGICGLLIAASMAVFVLDPPGPITGIGSLAWFVLSRPFYFLPCLAFGYLFGRVAAAAAQSWGNDVGRVYALNTLGSCAGVLVMTLIGYEIPFFMDALALALLLFALHEAEDARDKLTGKVDSRRYWPPAIGALAAIFLSFLVDLSGVIPGLRAFYGRDGVIMVDRNRNLMWDGLWHSRLSENNDHIGTANWYLAIAPMLAHQGPVKDACVIGLAAGVTAATIAKSGAMVDAYDINPGLQELYRRYPKGTLGVAQNPSILVRWQDARSGLALNDKKYDIIQTQPLYLKQAGSGLLNSVEFYRLISQRLKPGGIFSLYSNGTSAQAFAVRQTAAKVFPYRQSFGHGYLLLLSNDPIDISEESLRLRMQAEGLFWEEVRGFSRTRDAATFLQLFDPLDFPWGQGGMISSDDHPIIEYPDYLQVKIDSLGIRDLPSPGLVA
ncbi:MAG: hypothetical protein WCB36_01600 [Burkholderiales bacterium]